MIFKVFSNLNYSKVLWFHNTHLYQAVKCLTPLRRHQQEFHSSIPGWLPSLSTDLLELFIWCPVLQRGNHAGPCHACPWASSSTELSTNSFIDKKTRVMKLCHTVGYTSLLQTSVQRHFLKMFSLHQQCKSSVLELFKIWMPAAFLLAVCDFKGLFLH